MMDMEAYEADMEALAAMEAEEAGGPAVGGKRAAAVMAAVEETLSAEEEDAAAVGPPFAAATAAAPVSIAAKSWLPAKRARVAACAAGESSRSQLWPTPPAGRGGDARGVSCPITVRGVTYYCLRRDAAGGADAADERRGGGGGGAGVLSEPLDVLLERVAGARKAAAARAAAATRGRSRTAAAVAEGDGEGQEGEGEGEWQEGEGEGQDAAPRRSTRLAHAELWVDKYVG